VIRRIRRILRRLTLGSRMTRVLVESPYAPPPCPEDEDKEAWDHRHLLLHLCYLRAAMADCFARGEAPFASHGLYTQPGVLRDGVPRERALGIEGGLAWGRAADRTIVYTDLGISRGMKYGIDRAKSESRPIEYRTLPDWSGTKE
jgi:hypothetical protein